MHMVHIALQECKTLVLMLCKMAFHLCGKMFALQLDNSTAKSDFRNHCGPVLSFPD